MGLNMPDPVVLSCWKDIANYLGKGVRTVQRWERDFDMPVLRPKGRRYKNSVIARPCELDSWLASHWSSGTPHRQILQASEMPPEDVTMHQNVHHPVSDADGQLLKAAQRIIALSEQMSAALHDHDKVLAAELSAALHALIDIYQKITTSRLSGQIS